MLKNEAFMKEFEGRKPDAVCAMGLGVWYLNGALIPEHPLLIIENFLTAFGPILFQDLAKEREAAIQASKVAQAHMLATVGPNVPTKIVSMETAQQMLKLAEDVNKAKTRMVRAMFWLKYNPLSSKTREEAKALDPEEKVHKRKVLVLSLAHKISTSLSTWSTI
ncbi:hypothetical protein EMPS_04274 [Entomortierella parvispora]|uniref:Uncharacterized protein n=1 Tax=Entomortierella parvispora TaxID=205924 RepID=A0A9P3LVD2_9FUNG|nr:hypothetical protein EMPS_04274 [Entomortierella parvispora]